MNSAIRGLGETPSKAGRNNEKDTDNNVDVQSMKRSDYITWNDYFMAVACLASQRSKDPCTQVGKMFLLHHTCSTLVKGRRGNRE